MIIVIISIILSRCLQSLMLLKMTQSLALFVFTKVLLLCPQETAARRVDCIQSTQNISQYPQFSTASTRQLPLKVQTEGPPLDGCPGLVIERIRYLKPVFLLCQHFEDVRCNVYKQTINFESHSMRAHCSSCYFMYHHEH